MFQRDNRSEQIRATHALGGHAPSTLRVAVFDSPWSVHVLRADLLVRDCCVRVSPEATSLVRLAIRSARVYGFHCETASMRQSLLTPHSELDLSNKEELSPVSVIIVVVGGRNDNRNCDELFDGLAHLPRDNAVLLREASVHNDPIHIHFRRIPIEFVDDSDGDRVVQWRCDSHIKLYRRKSMLRFSASLLEQAFACGSRNVAGIHA